MSESALIWGGAALLVTAIVLPYALAFRRRELRDRERKQEAERLGIDRPSAQYPYVDQARCIGCAACVDVCPEGDVLGIVGGVATIVNGLRCIGHGACAEACPVSGIEVGLGDLKSREDIPLLDDWNETNLQGLFIAGELGGLALIRNAVAQGRKVATRIAERARRLGPAPSGALDVLAIGAGPAGLAAALWAKQQGLRAAVLEQEADLGGTILHYPRRKLVLVQPVELPYDVRLRQDEYTKENLLELLESLLERSKLNVHFGERATGLTREEDGLFRVHTTRGEYRARFVVLALGRRGTPRKLGVPGEELPKVTYKLIDAESYKGQRLLVVGGGDSAVEAAIGLARQGTNRVTLSYRREKLVRMKKKNEERLDELVRKGALRLAMPTSVVEVRPEAVRLRGADGEVEIPNDYVVVCAGGEPPFGFLREIGVRFGGATSPRP